MQAQRPTVVLVAQSLYQPPVRVRAVVLRSCVVPVAVVLGTTTEVWGVCISGSHGFRVAELSSRADRPQAAGRSLA